MSKTLDTYVMEDAPASTNEALQHSPFDVFEGGEGAVRQRFADDIRAALLKISFSDVAQVLRASNIDSHSLVKVIEGDLSAIKKPLVDALADPLNLSLQKAFGEMTIIDKDPSVRQRLKAQADEEGFMIIKGATPVKVEALDRLKLFALLKAYEAL